MKLALAVLLAAGLLGPAGPAVKVAVKAPGHTPKINVHWNYTITVTRGGKPVAARLSEAIVDPIGGAHAVEFGKTTKKITNVPIKGTFKDYIIWPASSRGIPLTFRVTVVVGGVRKVVNYPVVPRS